jgi:hypothetical protein
MPLLKAIDRSSGLFGASRRTQGAHAQGVPFFGELAGGKTQLMKS